MIINPMKCEKCNQELQPSDILVGTNDNGSLVRVCRFCDNEVEVK